MEEENKQKFEKKAAIIFQQIERQVADEIYNFYYQRFKNNISYTKFLETSLFPNEKIKIFINKIKKLGKDNLIYCPLLIEKFLLMIEKEYLDYSTKSTFKEIKLNMKTFLSTNTISAFFVERLKELQNQKNFETIKILCSIIKIVFDVNESEESTMKKCSLYKYAFNQLEDLKIKNENLFVITEKADTLVYSKIEQSKDTNHVFISNKENFNIINVIRPQLLQNNNKIEANPNVENNKYYKIHQVFKDVVNFQEAININNIEPIFAKKFIIPKMKNIKGDHQVKEFDEKDIFTTPLVKKNSSLTTENTKFDSNSEKNYIIVDHIHQDPKPILNEILLKEELSIRKSSIIFDDIAKDDLKMARERELTPVTRRVKNKKNDQDFYTEVPGINENKKTGKQNQINLNENTKIKKSSQSHLHHIHSDENSLIKVPNNYSTDDNDLKLLCDLINEKKEFGWNDVFIQENISIYRKCIKESPTIMIKTYATIDGFSKEEVFTAITDVNIRKEWDKIFTEFKTIESKEGKEFLYMCIKSPSSFVSDRDFVQQRKIWKDFPDNQSLIIHFKSVEHPLAPEKKKIVRAHTIISGYFIKTVSIYPPKTSIYIISQTDIKGSIPKWMVNKISQKAPKDWIFNLLRGCELVKIKK